MESPTEKVVTPDDKRGSIVEADVHSLGHDHGAESELRRMLGTRHLTMIALGSSIGMGLWLGSGTSLVNGGPAGIFIGYILAGSMIWSVSHSIGEMAIMYPLPSAYVQWTSKFICPAAAFALGWSYWFSYVITIANELAVGLSDAIVAELRANNFLQGCQHRFELLDYEGSHCRMDHHFLGRAHRCQRWCRHIVRRG